MGDVRNMPGGSEMLSPESRSKLIRFVLTMENPSGGFNYPRDTPASIEETYFALNILHILEETYSNEGTTAFVRNAHADSETSLKHLYQMACVCDLLGLGDKDREIGETFSVTRRRVKDITSLHYYLLLSKRYGTSRLREKTGVAILRRTLGSQPLSLSSAWRCIGAAEMLGQEIPRDRLLMWIQRSQNRDGGFGFYPGTTSFLENTWYALQGLHALRSKPRDPEGARRFVMMCESQTGGFSRQLSAVPTLEYSFMALLSLRLLDSMTHDSHDWGSSSDDS